MQVTQSAKMKQAQRILNYVLNQLKHDIEIGNNSAISLYNNINDNELYEALLATFSFSFGHDEYYWGIDGSVRKHLLILLRNKKHTYVHASNTVSKWVTKDPIPEDDEEKSFYDVPVADINTDIIESYITKALERENIQKPHQFIAFFKRIIGHITP